MEEFSEPQSAGGINWTRIVRFEFWYGWIWGVCSGLACALLAYFFVYALR